MTSNLDKKLSVVIPAFKGRYLEQALESLAGQSNQNFSTYVCDDCSPDDVSRICENFSRVLDLKFVRFKNNLGATSLARQWNRCVETSREDWVWLFCDDDVMDNNCVELFYDALATNGSSFDLYRFNTIIIDQQGTVVRINPPHPSVESSFHFAYHRFTRNRSSYVSEYLFSRKIFDEKGGFLDFPAGWCADDASWILFGEEKGIFTIPNGHVRWRSSQENISSVPSYFKREKLVASVEFIEWFNRWFECCDKSTSLIIEDIKQIQEDWLRHQVRALAPYPLSYIWSPEAVNLKCQSIVSSRKLLARANWEHFKSRYL